MNHGYIYYLVDQALNSKMSNTLVLSTLRDLCRDRDNDKKMYDFYLLTYAKEDLEESGVQFYWKDADKSNIDAIINAKFRDWKN